MSVLHIVGFNCKSTKILVNFIVLSLAKRASFFSVMKTHSDELQKKEGKIRCSSVELDLGITLKGGQSFRWSEHNNGFRGVYENCVWTLTQNKTHVFYEVQGLLNKNKDYDQILRDYFRLDLSLIENCKNWAAKDKHFEKLLSKTEGVRILNQDPVENVFSFICSSNNNIQRITSMVEKMCTLFGDRIGTIDEKEFYCFPSIESLAKENVQELLKKEKFGYRAGYISNAAKHLLTLGGRKWLEDLKKENDTIYSNSREQLMTLPGVGPKVADCVCLMSLGHLEAIPIDTHIFQVVKSNYMPHLNKSKTVTGKMHEEIGGYLRELWGPLAGWAQAIVFCARITDGKSEKRQNSMEKSIPKRSKKK